LYCVVSVSFRLNPPSRFRCYLFISHASQSYLEHVKIVPAARKTAIDVWCDFVDDRKDGAVCARSDAVWICGIAAAAEIVWSGE
jgi:hypothetical protein